jgi:hypothetical protein
MTWGITSWMVYTLSGLPLRRVFPTQQTRRSNTLQRCKRVHERILSGLLECFSQGGELSVDQLMGGIGSVFLIL